MIVYTCVPKYLLLAAVFTYTTHFLLKAEDFPQSIDGVAINFNTQTGKFYNIQATNNLIDWIDADFAVEGTGEVEQRFFIPNNFSDGVMFRIIESEVAHTVLENKEGPSGQNGSDGTSAYDIWLELGNTGSKQDFIDSLKGEPGLDADELPFSPGEVVQFLIEDEARAPDQNEVIAYEVIIPRGGGLKVEFELFETGSLGTRQAYADLYVNGHSKATFASGVNSSYIKVDYDLLGLSAGDSISVGVRVQNSDQSPYIDAHTRNFKLKSSNPVKEFIRVD